LLYGGHGQTVMSSSHRRCRMTKPERARRSHAGCLKPVDHSVKLPETSTRTSSRVSSRSAHATGLADTDRARKPRMRHHSRVSEAMCFAAMRDIANASTASAGVMSGPGSMFIMAGALRAWRREPGSSSSPASFRASIRSPLHPKMAPDVWEPSSARHCSAGRSRPRECGHLSARPSPMPYVRQPLPVGRWSPSWNRWSWQFLRCGCGCCDASRKERACVISRRSMYNILQRRCLTSRRTRRVSLLIVVDCCRLRSCAPNGPFAGHLLPNAAGPP